MKIIKSWKDKKCMYCPETIPKGDHHWHQSRGDKHYHLDCMLTRKVKQAKRKEVKVSITDKIVDRVYKFIKRF